MNHRIAVGISFTVNLSILVYALVMHSNMYPSHTSSGLDFKTILQAIVIFSFTAIFMFLPWLIAFSFKTEPNAVAAYIFSVLSVCSCLLFFVPPPLHPSEAIGFVVIIHILISYALLFISFLIGKVANRVLSF